MRAARAVKSICCSSNVSFSIRSSQNSIKLQKRYSATVECANSKMFAPAAVKIRNLGLGPTSKDFEEPTQLTGPLTKAYATELVLHLNDEERKILLDALQEYESNKIKEVFEGRYL